MISNIAISPFDKHFYLFGSRPATHGMFWLTYYVMFSLIWSKPETGYLGSFFLEFILLPVRVMAVYGMIYVLMPRYLFKRKYQTFFIAYISLLILAGLLQRLSGHFFYENLLLHDPKPLWQFGEWVRSIMLVNSTVFFVAAIRLFQLYLKTSDDLAQHENKRIEIKANRRTHLVHPDQVLYIEGMGNYVTYYLTTGDKLITYASIKSTLEKLPEYFIRLHKSYIVNKQHIDSFNAEDVIIGSKTLPRGKDISDELLNTG